MKEKNTDGRRRRRRKEREEEENDSRINKNGSRQMHR